MLRVTAPVQHEEIFKFIDPFFIQAGSLAQAPGFAFLHADVIEGFYNPAPAFGIRLCPLARPHYRWTENL